MVKERQDVTGSICLKDVSNRVVLDQNGIKDICKKYEENSMNEKMNGITMFPLVYDT